jgi:molecular chaperone GrpE
LYQAAVLDQRDDLLGELEAAREEAAADREARLRLAAEFDNYRKRVARDRASQAGLAASRVCEAMIPTLDSLDAALSCDVRGDGDARVLDGVRTTRDQLLATLAGEGFRPIEAEGHPFDPAVHEAVAGPSDGPNDLAVTAVLRTGYRLGDRVIRPVMVVVDHEE